MYTFLWADELENAAYSSPLTQSTEECIQTKKALGHCHLCIQAIHPAQSDFLGRKNISFISGLVEAGERKQASGLCSDTVGFVLGEISLWVPFGCKIRWSEK